MRKPRTVQYLPDRVVSYDAIGEEIPDLSGPYTDELKEKIFAASDERTQWVDPPARAGVAKCRFIHVQFPPGTTEEAYDAFVNDLGNLVNMHVEAYKYDDEPEVRGGEEVEPADKW